MKKPHNLLSLLSPLSLSLTAALTAAAAEAPSLDALQGAWSARPTNQEGQIVSQVLELKKDRFTFKVMNTENELRFFAQGAASVQKLGPFYTLKITEIKAGRSEDALEAVDDERMSVFVLDGDSLTLASNFDKTRANQPPRAETYTRVKNVAKSASASKLVGTWKMDVHIAETDSDYELRFAQTDGKLSATLISPRSGEHKFRKVTWADDKLDLELDREYEGNPVTLLYSGKLGADGLSGTVAAKGAEDQFSGTWKAKK